MLTKEQIQELGYSFYEAPEVRNEAGDIITNPLEYFGAGSSGTLQKLDPSTAEYLRSLGLLETTDRSSTGALSKYSTTGGSTITNQFLEGQYGQIAERQKLAEEEQRAKDLNAAIASGDTATVERLQPGYTLWNGAFVQTSQIPQLQAEGATVSGGNVVGAPLQTAQPLTSLPGEQPYTDPNQAGAWTPLQATNGMNQYYKDAQGNVFKLDGTPVSQEEFQKAGLNIAHINTKQGIDSRTSGQNEADQTFTDGAVTTGRTGGEQSDFMKSITDRMSKIDTLVADIVSSVSPTAEEKATSENLNKLTESFELGLVDIEGQTIPMKAIIGQQAQLERRAGVKIKALQNKLKLLGDDREAKGKALEVAYNASRQGVSDAIKLYEMTQPDRIAFDSKTGTVFFQNPMTGEVYQEKIPGFVPSSDPTALEEEYNLMKKSGYTGSLLDYVQFKATQFGTEKSGTDGDQQKMVTDFNKAISSWDYSTNANREQFIRQLQTAYGWSPANPNGINLDDIARKVYDTYPDNFNKLQ